MSFNKDFNNNDRLYNILIQQLADSQQVNFQYYN